MGLKQAHNLSFEMEILGDLWERMNNTVQFHILACLSIVGY